MWSDRRGWNSGEVDNMQLQPENEKSRARAIAVDSAKKRGSQAILGLNRLI
jgi:hypothetical protein